MEHNEHETAQHEEHKHFIRVTVEQVCEGTGGWDTATMFYARLRIDDEGDIEVATERREDVSALSMVEVFTDVSRALVDEELGIWKTQRQVRSSS